MMSIRHSCLCRYSVRSSTAHQLQRPSDQQKCNSTATMPQDVNIVEDRAEHLIRQTRLGTNWRSRISYRQRTLGGASASSILI
ncbi:hypothetical protein VTN02DRAFT_2782 [Thermoascus thermophilus]